MSLNCHAPIKWLMIFATLVVLVPVAGALSCYYESVSSGNVSANVPYFAQEQTYYCAAACVQMVAKWSGRDVSQDEAFIFMNGDPGAFGTSGGVRPDDYVRGVRAYTNEGDAYWDQAFYDDNNFIARQISAVTNKMPVFGIVQSGYHSVVLFAGSWHAQVDSSNNRTYLWDDVTYHDPSRGGGIQSTAGAWLSTNCSQSNPVCEQIVSSSAAQAGPKTLADYNPTVYAAGGDEGQLGGPKKY